MLLTVTPVPDTATDVPVVVKFVPVRVTATLVPRAPVGGAMELSVGAATPVPVNCTGEPSTVRLAVTVRLPLTSPALAGVKVTVIVHVPGVVGVPAGTLNGTA